MHPFFLTALFIFSILPLTFAGSRIGTVGDPAIVTGRVKITWSLEVKIGNSSIPITRDGIFYASLPLNGPDYLTIVHENQNIKVYLAPRDSVNIDLTSKPISFNGDNAKLNRALLQYEGKIQHHVFFLDQNNKAIFSKPLINFLSTIDSLQTMEVRSLKELERSIQLANAPRLKEILQAEVRFRSKYYKLLYPHNYNRHTSKVAGVHRFFYETIVDDDLDHQEFLSSESFVRLFNYYLDVQAAGKYKFLSLEAGPTERINSRYDGLRKLAVNTKVKNFFFKQHFKHLIANYNAKAIKTSLKRFQEDCKDEAIKKDVTRMFEKAWATRSKPNGILVYRHINGIELEAHVFRPSLNTSPTNPAYVFFHGGGWSMGSPEWGYGNCEDFASKGFTAIAFEYRLRNVHGTHIQQSVEDALSAVSWVKANSKTLNIDTTRIVVAGFSAGAHLAACTAAIQPSEISFQLSGPNPKPNYLILQSAPYSIEGRDAIEAKTKPEQLSPLNQVKNMSIPILAFHGKYDDMVSYSEFEKFINALTAQDADVIWKSFDRGHFFYDNDSRMQIRQATDNFLKTHDILK
jgi:acetyl esterase/lipase